MRRPIGIVVAVGIALGVAVVAASDADARPRKTQRPIQQVVRAESFSVSGEFTGRLEGWVDLSGDRFWVAPNATIYEIGGGGPLRVGTLLTAQRVTFSGTTRGNTQVVLQVTVRPFGRGGGYEAVGSGKVGVLDESAPQ